MPRPALANDRSVSRLLVAELTQAEVTSPLSGARAELVFEALVLNKYVARVYQDTKVPFAFVGAPTWLPEAYSDELPSLDTGMLQRNIDLANRVSSLLERPDVSAVVRSGVDVGGGYGIFVRAMRDRGHEFYWSDPFTRNLVSKGFEAKGGQYDVAAAFEVLEHTPSPLEFVKDVVRQFSPKIFLFTTECFSPDQIPKADWWYWSFETGQHISFFTIPALKYIAEAVGYDFFELGGGLFAFSKVDLSSPRPTLWSRAANRMLRVASLERTRTKGTRTSLTFSDHERLRDLLRRDRPENS